MATETSSGHGGRQPHRSSRTTKQTDRTTGKTRQSSRQTKRTSQAAAQTSQVTKSTGEHSQDAGAGQRGRSQDHTTTVALPFVTAHFHIPEMRLPSGDEVTSAANSVRAQLPSREHSLFYGALTAGTVFAFIDWPVALAIGVGHALLNRHTHQQESGASGTTRQA